MDLAVHNTVMLIKFGTQIVSQQFCENNGYQGEIKTLSNFCVKLFPLSGYWNQR